MRPIHVARALLVIPLVAGAVAACGGDGGQPAAERCDDTDPGANPTYANADVAFAAPEGEELQSSRAGGHLPWFTKFGLFVRGRGDVVIRVPAAQRDVVAIAGWGRSGGDAPQTDVRVETDSRCWTVYPGGLVFSGRQCVRLEVEGPGARRGSARFGLRRDCEGTTLTAREELVIGYDAGGWSIRTMLPDGSRTAKSRVPQN